MSVTVQRLQRLDHHAIDGFYDEAKAEPEKPKIAKRSWPEGAVAAHCTSGSCPDSIHPVFLPKRAVTGAKCGLRQENGERCKAELYINHKTNRVTYKGNDSCVCYNCTPGELIANARDVPKRK